MVNLNYIVFYIFFTIRFLIHFSSCVLKHLKGVMLNHSTLFIIRVFFLFRKIRKEKEKVHNHNILLSREIKTKKNTKQRIRYKRYKN